MIKGEIPEIPRLIRERASDGVYQIIRDRILTHVFAPGEQLDLKEVGERIGVSRTPVKEAINRLVSEGLVEVRPQSGTYVTEIIADEIAEIFEIRMALECLAAESAIKFIDEETIEGLRKILVALEEPTTSEEARSLFINRDFEFHTRIVELSRNRKLLELYHRIDARIKVARLLYNSERWTQRVTQASSEHREILRRLEGRDAEGLVKALRSHIKRVSKCLVDDLRELERNGGIAVQHTGSSVSGGPSHNSIRAGFNTSKQGSSD